MNTDPTQLPLNDLQQQKFLRTFLRTGNNPALFKSQPDLYSYVYVDKFNLNLQHQYENAYKTKNLSLFTWRQSQHIQKKLKSPPSLNEKFSHLKTNLKEIMKTLPDSSIPFSSAPQGNFPGLLASDRASSRGHKKKKLKGSLGGTQKNFYTSPNTFKTQESTTTTLGRQVDTPYINFKDRKSYSISKMQTNLLNPKSISPRDYVPNFEYMSNQFDRKCQTINKIISRIKPCDEMLDKDEIKQETLCKLRYISKDSKIQTTFKPKTALGAFTARKLKIPQTVSSKEPETTNTQEPNFPMKTTRDRTTKLFQEEEMGRMSTPNESKTAIRSIMTKDEGPVFKIIDKNELNAIINKRKKDEGEKSERKSFSKNLDSALKTLYTDSETEVQTQPQPQPQAPVSEKAERKSSRFGIKTQSRRDSGAKLVPQMSNAKKELKVKNLMTAVPIRELSDENIFNFGKYFKKKYLETGFRIEMSKDLQGRIQSFGKELGLSARKLEKFPTTNETDETIFTNL